VLEIDESTLDTDEWSYHPNKPVAVNQAGTHVYHLKKQIFLNVRLYEWKTCDWKLAKVSVDGKDTQLDRLALECFIGRELLPGETVEHIDCNRANQSEPNLLPRYRLFQANARKLHKFVVDGKVTGVTPQGDQGFCARIRVYTPDGCSASVEKRKYFSATKYGSRDEAERAAIAYRRHFDLKEGMQWI
jgi:hypothetical protein